jgi:RNA polymerase sigma-70 factor (ECF subfamily)
MMNAMVHQATSGGPADEQLLRRAVGGDPAAFGTIVERYQDRLYNAAYRLLGSAEDARDVVQEAFLKAYAHLDRFGGRSSLYTWLFRITVNMGLSHRRKRKWERRTLPSPGQDQPDPLEGLVGRADADPVGPLLSAETERIVQRALQDLDPEHRAVVVLRDIQQFDYGEIAEVLKVPTGTVKSRLHRARLMLRDSLRPLLKDVPA